MRIALVCLAFLAAMPASAASMSAFINEQAAMQHCPGSGVVWLSLQAHGYYLKGDRNYGTSKGGAYVCEPEADAAGYRALRH